MLAKTWNSTLLVVLLVLAGVSEAAAESSWLLRLERVFIDSPQEAGGDEPYFAVVGFRAAFGHPTATRAFWSGYLTEVCAGALGGSCRIPAQMGVVDFGAISPQAIGDPIEVVGAVVLGMESDGTPFSTIRTLVDRLRGALERELRTLIGREQLDVLDPVRRDAQLRAAEANVRRAVELTTAEEIGIVLDSYLDPDDEISVQSFFFPVVSLQLGDGGLAALQEGSLERAFRGDGASWRVVGQVDRVYNVTQWTAQYSDNAVSGGVSVGWNTDQSLWGTIQFADVNGDGRADVCSRDIDGVRCGLSVGQSFNYFTYWAPAFSNANGWSLHPSYWETIRFPDVNGDGRADVCGRGGAGIICGLSETRSGGAGAFSTVTVWSGGFSDANGWGSDPSYWKTIRFPDLNRDGKSDVCGRGIDGVICALSNGTSFGTVRVWSSMFSDRNGWNIDPSYWGTIQFADVDGDSDRLPDVCGRGIAGVWCARNTYVAGAPNREPFENPSFPWTSMFSDAGNWHRDRSYWSTIQLADINGDGRADICGRDRAGLYCGQSTGTGFVNMVAQPGGLLTEFSDTNGWSAERFYATIRFVDVNGDGRADVCGRGVEGIYCAKASSLGSAVSFHAVWVRVTNFGDIYGWGTAQSYWGTVQPAHIDTTPGADWCGRGSGGIYCSSDLVF